MTRSKMKIALNLPEFHPGKMGGGETYVREPVTRLARPDSGCGLTLLCSERDSEYSSGMVPGCSHMPVAGLSPVFGKFP